MQQITRCPKCGIQYGSDQESCNSCGSPLIAACPNCKRPVVLGSKNCYSCGTEIVHIAKAKFPGNAVTSQEIDNTPFDSNLFRAMLFTCQSCGHQGNVKHVLFYQNIGLFFIRMHKSIDGLLCKSCIHHYFWEFTMITLFLGWWGVISFFFTLFILPNNIIRYIGALIRS